jgi:protocatechuate 3,4-dioxygenase beta subunit
MKKSPGLTRRELLALGASLPLGAVAAADDARAAEACGLTPRQTSGPFFPAFDQLDKDVDLTRGTGHDGRAEGEVIRVRGRVLDEQCRPVEGALVDLWQANAKGRYAHPADRNPAPLDPNFQGWGQAVTDAEGRYSFTTIKPAPYPLEFVGGEADTRSGFRTPHLHFRVSKRGHRELSTQMYFAGEALNERDAVLARVPASERPRVVVAPQRGADVQPLVFVFDVVIARG